MGKIQTKQHIPSHATSLGILRWLVLWFPLALFPLAVFGAGRYPLVLREDTVAPIVGAPRSLVLLSPVVAIAYLILIFLVSRRQVSDTLHSKVPRASALPLYIALTLLFTTWGAGQSLNGMLDFSQPRIWRTKVVGLTRLKVTPYIEVQDWKNSAGFVYLRVNQTFRRQHPVGSSLTVTTRDGLFGYEWYAR